MGPPPELDEGQEVRRKLLQGEDQLPKLVEDYTFRQNAARRGYENRVQPRDPLDQQHTPTYQSQP